MKTPALILFMVLVFASMLPLSEGNPGRPLDITSLIINFDKTDATFTVNYDLGKMPKMYVLLFGSKSIAPRIKAVFPNFDYDILKMDQDKTILRVKNISRLEKGFYLHDSRRLGASINTIIVYTPDLPRPTEYSNKYLFSWDDVIGNESLIVRFLKYDLNLSWVQNAKILKADDDKTIRVFTDENSVEIVLDKDTDKALLKISDGRTYDLQVIEDRGKLYIYSTSRYSTPDIYYRS